MFTGREYDSETGLYHYRERSYSPQIGRFLQRDPLQIDDENTYSYCDNDPINYVDPQGLIALDANGALSGGPNNPINFIDPDDLAAAVSIATGAGTIGTIYPPLPQAGGNVVDNGKITLLGSKDSDSGVLKKGVIEKIKDWLQGKKKPPEKKGLWNKIKDWWKKHGPTIVNKPTHKGIDLPGKRNIIHWGKDPRFGKTGHHIGIWYKGPMEAKWHKNF